MKRIWYLTLILALLINACVSSEASDQSEAQLTSTDIARTHTAVAAAIFASQTAQATIAPTRTPWPTLIPSITSSPTLTPIPTATLQTDEIPNLILCYEAAVNVYADWEAYLHIIKDHRLSSNDKLGIALSQFRAERSNRKGVDLVWTNACKPFASDIRAVSEFIDRENPWGLGSSNRRSEYILTMKRMVNTLRKALIEVYLVDPAELDAIDEPVWQNVIDRYDVEKPY